MLEGLGVLLGLDLLEGLIGTLVEFELDDVYVVGCLDEEIDATVAGVMLYFGIEADKSEDDPDGILEIEFSISGYLVVAIGKESVKALHEFLWLSCTNFFHEGRNE